MTVTDQYARFHAAMNPVPETRKREGIDKWLYDNSFKYSILGPYVLLAALCLGNLAFLEHLGWTGASFVGNYALKIQWSDGHDTGLYSWDWLEKLRRELAG